MEFTDHLVSIIDTLLKWGSVTDYKIDNKKIKVEAYCGSIDVSVWKLVSDQKCWLKDAEFSYPIEEFMFTEFYQDMSEYFKKKVEFKEYTDSNWETGIGREIDKRVVRGFKGPYLEQCNKLIEWMN